MPRILFLFMMAGAAIIGEILLWGGSASTLLSLCWGTPNNAEDFALPWSLDGAALTLIIGIALLIIAKLWLQQQSNQNDASSKDGASN